MRPPYKNVEKLGFGQYFTDHMYLAKWHADKGWYEKGIVKYEPFRMDPAACTLHYAQEVFEGQKAYAADDGRILMFRPTANARRINRSAEKLCLPAIPEEMYLKALEELILHEKEWIPRAPGTSLYVRPTIIGTECFLGVRPSVDVLFYIILSPVGAYYKEGYKPIGIYVEDTMVRSAPGGLGDIKAGANYGASLLAGQKAKEKGYAQVLWLDACEHRYVEEVGSMNVFFVYGNKLVTPALTGSILPGITRDSIMNMARNMGYEAEEAHIPIEQVLEDIKKGTLTEMFGSGTAAVVSPVGHLFYKGNTYDINNREIGKVTNRLYETLVDMQYGRIDDPYGWVVELGRL